MNQVEKGIKIAAKLYEARDHAKALFGDKYREQMDKLVPLLKGKAERDNASIMETILAVAKDTSNMPAFQTLLFAAAVEICDAEAPA